MKPSAQLLARRLQDQDKDQVAKAEQMANAIVPKLPQKTLERDLGEDITSLQPHSNCQWCLYQGGTRGNSLWCRGAIWCKQLIYD